MCSKEIILNRQSWKTYEEGCEREWLLSNGLGGYSSSTVIGANDRRYHGLLIASFNPPVNRHLILAKIDESIISGDKKTDLFSHKNAHGHGNLLSFKMDPLPLYTYKAGGVTLVKTICMVHGENTVIIGYRLFNGGERSVLRLCPLINYRDHHHISGESNLDFSQEERDGIFKLTPSGGGRKIHIRWDRGTFTQNREYFKSMYYSKEEERGLECFEDHYIPGYLEIEAGSFETIDINISVTVDENSRIFDPDFDPEGEMGAQRERIENLTARFPRKDRFFKRLVVSSDHFIVKRESVGSQTVLAGYPWFNDWGRDAMIALPGLCLVTERFEDARGILKTFASYLKGGLIPNTFPDGDNLPYYNTADASLWFIEAVYKYYEATGDIQFIREGMMDKILDVIHGYKGGTLFNIHGGEDCLLYAGDEGTQLTWMDAKADGEVFTPRHGLAVELNALWYNSVRIGGEFLNILKDERSKEYLSYSEGIKESFLRAFWNGEMGYLYDSINGDIKDDNLRPNQIMALSLSFPVLQGEKALAVIDKVYDHLVNSLGIRSLWERSPQYGAIYEGSPYYRDSIYHRGTSWIWLFGHFILAILKNVEKSPPVKEWIRLLFDSYEAQLDRGCLGNLPEISDGQDTGRPRGCFAQAWSTAEVLRAYNEFLRW